MRALIKCVRRCSLPPCRSPDACPFSFSLLGHLPSPVKPKTHSDISSQSEQTHASLLVSWEQSWRTLSVISADCFSFSPFFLLVRRNSLHENSGECAAAITDPQVCGGINSRAESLRCCQNHFARAPLFLRVLTLLNKAGKEAQNHFAHRWHCWFRRGQSISAHVFLRWWCSIWHILQCLLLHEVCLGVIVRSENVHFCKRRCTFLKQCSTPPSGPVVS